MDCPCTEEINKKEKKNPSAFGVSGSQISNLTLNVNLLTLDVYATVASSPYNTCTAHSLHIHMYTYTHTYIYMYTCIHEYIDMYIGRQETNVCRLKYECMNLTKDAVLGSTYNIRSIYMIGIGR
jgi:hypothetical protein